MQCIEIYFNHRGNKTYNRFTSIACPRVHEPHACTIYIGIVIRHVGIIIIYNIIIASWIPGVVVLKYKIYEPDIVVFE